MRRSSIVVAGFPGVGKSVLTSKGESFDGIKFIDSDSSTYSWYPNPNHPNRIRNPDFPDNYIKHIKDFMDHSNYIIFVSTHSSVLDALEKAKIPVALVYPKNRTQINEYIERYKKRGSPEQFINNIKTNWGVFLECLRKRTSHLFTHYRLDDGQYLADIIDNVYSKESELANV